MLIGNLGQDFAVEVDITSFQRGYESGICDLVGTNRGVDFNLPFLTHSAFLFSAVAIAILSGFEDCFFGQLKDGVAAAAISFGALDPFFVASAGGGAIG